MTWDEKFAIAEKYYKEHGDLRVSPGEIFDGFEIYDWIEMQRRRYRKSHGYQRDDGFQPLSDEQINRLESIGMLWDLFDYAWERAYAAAERYYQEHGNLEVPKHYEMDGVKLSHWIWQQRRIVAGTEKGASLSEEKIRRLEEIGMDWAPKSKGFTYYYQQAKKFYDAYGHTDFPNGEICINGESLPESGERLNAWKADLNNPRTDGKRNAFEVHRKELCEIGINPTGWKIIWERYFDAAEQYYQEHGNLFVPYLYYTKDGMPLGKWISRQRMRRNGTIEPPLAEERIRRLDEIGMIWNPPKGPHRKSSGAETEMADEGVRADNKLGIGQPATKSRRNSGPRR